MRKTRLKAVTVLCAVAALTAAQAQGAIEISLGGPDLTNTPPSATVPNNAIVLSFANTATTNKVRLSIDVNGTSTKVKEILFNVDPLITGLSFAAVSGPTPTNLASAFSANNKGIGGPLTGFDVELKFGTSGANGALWHGSSLAVIDITRTAGTATLTENSFSVANSNGHFGAVHINNPNGAGGNSGKYGTPPEEVIPEPATFLVWSLTSLMGITMISRRRTFCE